MDDPLRTRLAGDWRVSRMHPAWPRHGVAGVSPCSALTDFPTRVPTPRVSRCDAARADLAAAGAAQQAHLLCLPRQRPRRPVERGGGPAAPDAVQCVAGKNATRLLPHPKLSASHLSCVGIAVRRGHWLQAMEVVAQIFATFLGALILSLMLESPIHGLERALLGRCKSIVFSPSKYRMISISLM